MLDSKSARVLESVPTAIGKGSNMCKRQLKMFVFGCIRLSSQ